MDDTREKYLIDKEHVIFMKGIAILMMLIHHAFTFPKWIIYPGGGYRPNIVFSYYFNSPTKLCVCIFAFISGWAFALDMQPTIRKVCKKVLKFLVSYWIICIPMMGVATIICGYSFQILEVFGELVGISNKLMIFCWYVPFYIISLFVIYISRIIYDT